jgi:hypothetical protein
MRFSIAAVLMLFSVSLFAQTTDKAAADKAKMDQEKMQAVWMEYMSPGPMHKMLASGNGTWHEEITMWMAPGAPPSTNHATCEASMILGERYQQSKHKGEFDGMPFEGIGITGYDNSLKKFVSTWVDNMGTGIMYMEGTWNEKTKTIEFKGKMVDPMTGTMTPVRETFTFVDDNTQIMEMFMTANGKEYKSMHIKLTRG